MQLTVSDLKHGCAAYREHDPRDSMYRIAVLLLGQPDWWGNFGKMTDVLTVFLLSWNASFYRYSGGWLDGDRLECCLRLQWANIQLFHGRDIRSFTNRDGEKVHALFEALHEATKIRTAKANEERRSPVSAAKALHILAPGFFPIWDYEVARKYKCPYSSENAAKAYLRFFVLIRDIAAGLAPTASSEPGRSLVKQIDEYNFARFSNRWIS